MDYEAALKAWGAAKLQKNSKVKIDADTVEVDVTVYYGGYCETCGYETGGISIEGKDVSGKRHETVIEKYTFSFAELVKEIVEAGQSA